MTTIKTTNLTARPEGTMTTSTESPYVWLICNDLSPRRASVIRICETGTEARRAMACGGELLLQPVLRSDRTKVGDRIWRMA